MTDAILGISAYYHDSAAVLLVEGEIVAAAQEERFTRKKHDASFPVNAIRYVMSEAGIEADQIEIVSFYDKPFLKFERLLETYHAFAPQGIRSFLSAMPAWIKEKLFMRTMLNKELAKLGFRDPRILFPEHHLSHAASAFYPSPFDEAAILTIDGVGEWATTTICHGRSNSIEVCLQIDFPHSLGLLYSAFTHYCGFRVNSGEYKLMGLAPYGNPHSERAKSWKQAVFAEMVDLREDGSFLLNMEYFDYTTGRTMCNDSAWERLFGIPRRKSEAEALTQAYMDLAAVVQAVAEEIILKLASTARKVTGCDLLCLAGGVALNCVANGRLLRAGIFTDIWIQPAAGDAGGALGAAFAAHHIWQNNERKPGPHGDAMKGSYLGPEFSSSEVKRAVRKYSAVFSEYQDFGRLCEDVAELLAAGNVVGWFQGRMEYGPRALGNRSILGDPRNPGMQKKMNLKIKFREGFRPFAPSVLEEDIQDYFELDRPSPYMLLVAQVKDERLSPLPPNYAEMELYERLYHLRSDVQAVTHVDYSARIQSVSDKTNKRYWTLIDAFKKKTGYGLVVNTSFNVRGEPIVLSPDDAYRCFMGTEIDYLVIENMLFDKKTQQPLSAEFDRKSHFTPD